MAFGTGHHETTLSMIEIMQHLDFHGRNVFDYGCGTGILAILASKMGASSITALDYDPLSYENTIENSQKNKIDKIKTFLGELSIIKEDDFDIILANINRNYNFKFPTSVIFKDKTKWKSINFWLFEFR